MLTEYQMGSIFGTVLIICRCLFCSTALLPRKWKRWPHKRQVFGTGRLTIRLTYSHSGWSLSALSKQVFSCGNWTLIRKGLVDAKESADAATESAKAAKD
jgi:hypothetical protein